MKSLILIISLPVVVGLVIGGLALAGDEGSVTATVTTQNVSVSVTDGTVTYGTVSLSSSKSTVDLSDTQTATNNGNVTEDFNIKGQNSAAWTLAGSIGANQYKHEFSLTGSFPGTALTANYQELTTDIAASGNDTFDLKLSTPSSSASYTEQTVSVTVQAVASS